VSEIEELAESIRERRAMLFVGAGLSMSLGLPSWESLIDHMAEELDLDRGVIGGPDCTYQMLAEYYRLEHGSVDALRSWMARKWRVSEDLVKNSALHELIVGLDFPIIYTTNYDRNLEVAYEVHERPFVRIIAPRDVARVSEGVTQIIKFHGDFDDEASMVLAETDYFNRLSFEAPLDVKFRSDALGRTILFIGYSMSDVNIRLLLHRLWTVWAKSGYEQDRPRSYVFMPDPSPIQKAILERWGITVLSEPEDDPQRALGAFLTKLRDRVDQL
jgi:hypothetical protein